MMMISLALPLVLACVAFAGWLRGRMGLAMVVAPIPAFLTALEGASAGTLQIGSWVFSMDLSGSMLMGAAALLWMAAGAFAWPEIKENAGSQQFQVCWFLTMTGSLGVFLAADLVSFLMLFALASLPAYGLVIHEGTSAARRAGAIYLGCAIAGETCLLSGFVLLAINSPEGSLMIADVVGALPESPWRNLTLGLLIAGFIMKMGLVPAHFWLPLAHPAAPAAGSAVLSGAIIKAGVIGLVRFLPMETPAPDWGMALAWGGLVTALYGVIVGMTQTYPKTILAYSSVSQMGVIAAMLGMGLAAGEASVGADASFYAMHHLFAKGALFLGVGVVAASGKCGRWTLFVPCAVLALGMAGLPFTGGALAKLVSKNILGSGWAYTFAGISAAGTALLMFHFLSNLKKMARTAKKRNAHGILMAAFCGLAMTGAVLRWAVFEAAGFGNFAYALDGKGIVASTIPVAIGGALYILVAKLLHLLPKLPAGDIVNCSGTTKILTLNLANILSRWEFRFRNWAFAATALAASALAIWLLARDY